MAATKKATASKTKNKPASATKKTITAKKTVKKAVKATFPTKELNAWLKGRQEWNHNDWLNLLADLEKKGHKDFIATEEGRHQVGQYLENNRK